MKLIEGLKRKKNNMLTLDKLQINFCNKLIFVIKKWKFLYD